MYNSGRNGKELAGDGGSGSSAAAIPERIAAYLCFTKIRTQNCKIKISHY